MSTTMETAPITDSNAVWKQRYRLPHYGGQLARCNQARGLVVSNQSGIYQLYAWKVSDGTLRQLTHHPYGKKQGNISADGRYVYYLDDTHGDETGHFVRVDVDTDEQIDLTPDIQPYAVLGFHTDCVNRTIAYLAVDREHGCQLFTQSVTNDTIEKPKVIYQTSEYTIKPVLSYEGSLVVIETTNVKKGTGSILLVFDAVQGGPPMNTLDDGVEVNVTPKQFGPLPDDARLLASSRRTGVNRPLIWNVRTNERVDFPLDQLGDEGHVEPLDWSADGQFILLSHICNATFQLYCYCLATESLTKLAQHPSGTILHAEYGPDATIVVQWESASAPRQTITLNSKTGALERVLLASQKSESLSGRQQRSVTFPSSDGQLIQGWLTLPRIDGAEPFPTIIHMHGGPLAVTMERFDPEAEAWADHDFGFFSINYRGSITFGQAFEHQIYSDIGHWELEDIVAARTWLVAQGIAKPNAVLLTGRSYGGFLTLLALGKEPHLWAGGLAAIAIADWTLLYEDSAESLKTYAATLFGGSPKEKPELYTAASPITYVEQILAPVLIIQATNDTRCPMRQMKGFETKLRQLGKNADIEWFDGGHALNSTEQSIVHMEKMLCYTQRIFGKKSSLAHQ